MSVQSFQHLMRQRFSGFLLVLLLAFTALSLMLTDGVSANAEALVMPSSEVERTILEVGESGSQSASASTIDDLSDNHALALKGALAPSGAIIYVDAEATGADDGTSWTDAYPTLQDALAAASSGDEIWVAEGVYYPDEGTGQTDDNRDSTFTMLNGVAIYGGFAGGEISLAGRDVVNNVTVLSGDIDGNDNNKDGNGIISSTDDIQGGNAYNVVTGGGTDNSAILDGFTINAGNANGSSFPNHSGGGIYNDSSPTLANLTITANSARWGGGMYNDDSSSPTLTNLTISANSASDEGGGIYNYYSDPTLTNVTIEANSADSHGGGMYNDDSSPTLTNLTISANSADSYGGGIYNDSSNPTLANVTISANTASYGGGMYNEDSNPTLANLIISANSASNDGGGMYNEDSSPTLANLTISANSASNDGGGMYNYNSSSPTLTNVIIWNNQANGSTTSASASIDYNTSSPSISYSLIANSGGSTSWDSSIGTDGGHNIDADPHFVADGDPSGPTDGDYHLQSGSAAIDAGDNSVCPSHDIRGEARDDLACDIGAYEYEGDPVCFSTIDGITVYSSADSQALRDGIAAANNNQTVKVAGTCAGVTAGHIAFITKSLTIQGGYTTTNWSTPNPTSNPTMLDARKEGRVIAATDCQNCSLRLENLTIINGNSVDLSSGDDGGAVYSQYEQTSIIATTFMSNASGDGEGGAVYAEKNLSIENSLFTDNNTDDGDGAAFYTEGDLLVIDSRFERNECSSCYGGAASINGDQADIRNSQFLDNSNDGYEGGAIQVYGDTFMRIEDSLFARNHAAYGGAIYTYGEFTTITNTEFISNSDSSGYGGALYLDEGGQIVDSYFAYNWSDNDSGVGSVHQLIFMFSKKLDSKTKISDNCVARDWLPWQAASRRPHILPKNRLSVTFPLFTPLEVVSLIVLDKLGFFECVKSDKKSLTNKI